MSRSSAKSYWMGVSTITDREKQSVLSWFMPLCSGMAVESAQILCDVATDREKKIKAVMVDDQGVRRMATRTLGGKTFTIRLITLPEAAK
jgi:hypothetical protein